MLAHHRGLGITSEQRFRFASLMSLAADDAALPGDPEFRAALVGYLEWGTRIAQHNSQPDAEVMQHAPRAALGLGRRAAVPALIRWRPARAGCKGRGMPDIHFDEEIAASYDDDSDERFDPALLARTTEFLADLAGDGRALELAIGTGRVALPLAAARGAGVGHRAVAVHARAPAGQARRPPASRWSRAT